MRAEVFLQGLIAFLIVAFGQPSFAPWLGPIAAACGYALFWRAVRIYPFRRQRFWRAGLWYASVCFVQLSWMSAIEYQGIYILFIWFGLSLWLGAQFGLLSILIPYNRSLSFPRILSIASIWTLIEWMRFHCLCGFSWNLSGMALSNPYSLQLAAVFGILGLSFWVILANLLALRAFLKKGIPRYLIWGGVVCLPYLFGLIHLTYHQMQKEKIKDRAPYTCLLVQTGLLPCEKAPLQGKVKKFISPYDQWARILYLVKEDKDKHPDLIVLPEAAVPFLSETAIYNQRIVKEIFYAVFGSLPEEIFPSAESTESKVTNAYWVQTLANLFKSEVVNGLDHQESTGSSFNSAFHIKPFCKTLERYDKRVLMPLAEYLPLACLTPLVKAYGLTDFFTHGKEAKIFEGKIPLSTSICYEETFPEKVREGRLRGGKMLINITNDGWYPFSRLPSQHYEHARLRAIENGAPLLRACNTGVSAGIDSLGKTVAKLDQGKEKTLRAGALFIEMDPYEYFTLFTLWGNKGIIGISLAFFGLFVLLKKRLYW